MKVSTAMICLDCDELHTEDVCPKCLSHHSFPLRKWVPPVASFEAIKKEVKNAKIRNNKIQKNPQEAPGIWITNRIHGNLVQPILPSTKLVVYSPNEIGLYEDSNIASFKSEISGGNHYSGEQLETESSVVKGSNRIDAGNATKRKDGWLEVFKRRFNLFRTKYNSRDNNTEALSKNQPKLESST